MDTGAAFLSILSIVIIVLYVWSIAWAYKMLNTERVRLSCGLLVLATWPIGSVVFWTGHIIN